MAAVADEWKTCWTILRLEWNQSIVERPIISYLFMCFHVQLNLIYQESLKCLVNYFCFHVLSLFALFKKEVEGEHFFAFLNKCIALWIIYDTAMFKRNHVWYLVFLLHVIVEKYVRISKHTSFFANSSPYCKNWWRSFIPERLICQIFPTLKLSSITSFYRIRDVILQFLCFVRKFLLLDYNNILR